MRQLYALIFFLPFVFSLHAQSLETAPAGGNPALKSYAIKKAAEQAALVERMTGSVPPAAGIERGDMPCPPEWEGNLVESGSEIIVEIDTFDLANDTFTPVLTVVNPLQFGTVTFVGNEMTYTANDGLASKAIETIWVEYSQPSDKDTIQLEITVKRRGKTITATTKTVAAGSVSEYCLDNEPDFPAAKACSEFLEKDPAYDGVGQQNYYFQSYAYPDSCMVYWASRFPGTDVVSMRICDELTVCDTFEIPFIITGDTLSIASQPFFDDFSSYRTPYPTPNYWLDNDVFVNTTLAKDPPSVGFATFDGLDFQGDVLDILTGPADKLTSKAIDLSGLNAGSSVSLRFFLAPKGYGLEPEVNDTLILEFRNNEREWVRITTFYGMDDVDLDSFPAFVFFGFPVNQPEFFHSAFQFRFRNFVTPGGAGDLWHLDYVFFDKNEDAQNDVFEDIAFTSLPSNLLKSYTSMPWRHFEDFVAEEVNEQFSATFFNNNDSPLNFANSGVRYRETTTGTDFGVTFTLNETGTNFPAKSFEERSGNLPGQPFATIKNVLQNLPSADFRNVETTFAFANSSQAFLYESNDTVRIQTPFSDYFAHDDGSAEWQIFIKFAAGGEQIATRFHANLADTMRAVQFMFPQVNGDVQSQLFNLRIWTSDPAEGNEPAFEQESLKPFYANNVFDTLQGYTTYRLEDIFDTETPLFIPAGDFWVGWQQGTATQLGIPVGFDIQNPCNCNISNLDGTWKDFPPSIAGSLMIRPVFSKEAPNNTSNGVSEGQQTEKTVEIFPNPTTGLLHFYLKKGVAEDYKVQIFNHLGQIVRSNAFAEMMDLSDLPAGAYWLQMMNEQSGERFFEKVILQK